MSDTLPPAVSFLDLYATLPVGGLRGRGTDVFQTAEMPEPFIAPNFSALIPCERPEVTLVSARGATGKSVLAKRLSAMANVPLWQLAEDKGVSGDAVEAKLNRYLGSNGINKFKADQDALIVVDALDEARMRVSGVSWAEFVQSLVALTDGSHHLVLMGRERVIEDVWLQFAEANVDCQWFEILHFDAAQRAQYVDVHVGRHGAEAAGDVYLEARDAVLKALAGTVDAGLSEAFVGYAPVLDAVAALLAQGNLIAVINHFEETSLHADTRIAVLAQILEDLLAREQIKVRPSVEELGLEPEHAYGGPEQIKWLAADLMGGEQPALDWCPPERRVEYVDRLRGFLGEHPFRSENRWASPVFSAYVGANRFSDGRIRTALQSVGAETGLLFDFVTANAEGLIDEWQFASLHASMLAAEWRELEATVSIEPSKTGDLADSVLGELLLVEESQTRRNGFEIALERSGELNLLGPTAYLTVDFAGRIRLSRKDALALGPECFIRCGHLALAADTVEIARRVPVPGETSSDEPSVTLEATEDLSIEGTLVGPPGADTFELRVPESAVLVYPWVTFRAPVTPSTDGPNERAARFLNMLMRLLRRHGHKGRQAVFDKKLEGCQSIKADEFRHAVGVLEAAGAVSYEGALIYLQPDWETHWFNGKGRPGQPGLEDKWDVWGGLCEGIAKGLS